MTPKEKSEYESECKCAWFYLCRGEFGLAIIHLQRMQATIDKYNYLSKPLDSIFNKITRDYPAVGKSETKEHFELHGKFREGHYPGYAECDKDGFQILWNKSEIRSEFDTAKSARDVLSDWVNDWGEDGVIEFKVIHCYKTTITASEIIDSGRFCYDDKQEAKHELAF